MSRYTGRIKVVGMSRMCWPVDSVTLESLGVSCFDSQPWTDPAPAEIISEAQWYMRRAERERASSHVTGIRNA